MSTTYGIIYLAHRLAILYISYYILIGYLIRGQQFTLLGTKTLAYHANRCESIVSEKPLPQYASSPDCLNKSFILGITWLDGFQLWDPEQLDDNMYRHIYT